MVLSPFIAANATFALNADEWLRRFLLISAFPFGFKFMQNLH